MNYLIMFLVVLLFPLILLVIIGFYTALGGLLDRLLNKEIPPYCDIDPLCHSGFYWDTNGDGWIHGIKVNKAVDRMKSKEYTN